MKKILLVTIITASIIGFCFLFGFFNLIPDLQHASYTKTDLMFANYNDTLYFKNRSEGNEKVVVLSTLPSEEFDVDTSSEFIYDVSSGPLLYKQTVDSLIIYTMTSSKLPDNFKSRVNVLQIEIDNPEMMKLINNKNYLNIGLKRIE